MLRGSNRFGAMSTTCTSFPSGGSRTPSAAGDPHCTQPPSALVQLARLLGRLAARRALKTDTGNELSDEPKSETFTEKNRCCLRQFADFKKLESLLTLPQRIIAQVGRRHAIRRRDAVRVELAIAVAILLSIPLRAGNLAGLRLDRHLHVVGDRTFLSISPDETKNAVAIEAELPARLAQQLQTYIQHYRPILIEAPSPWLFPGQNGARRPSGGFGQQLSDFVAREAGAVMTPHQFRHLAAKFFLDQHPDGFETVRRLLGHKSIETTMRYYHEFESVRASKRYAAVLDELLADLQCRIAPRDLKAR